jgi:hypothetical protein
VTAEAALFKARMVALLALGSRSAASHDEVAFGDIQKALDIPAEQVGSHFLVHHLVHPLVRCAALQLLQQLHIATWTSLNSHWKALLGRHQECLAKLL